MLVYKSKFLTVDADHYTYPHKYRDSNGKLEREEERHAIHIALTVQMNGDLKRFEYEEMFEPQEGTNERLFGSETTNKLYEFLLACDYLPNSERESNESNLPYLIHKSVREQMKDQAKERMDQIPNLGTVYVDSGITTSKGALSDITYAVPQNFTLTK